MSDENQEVEQITKNPQPTKSKVKDPKKVAAGKKLAEYNRKAKEALAREMKREAETSPEETTQAETPHRKAEAWIPELSFTTVLSLVGIGFTAVDMYMRFYKKKEGEQSRNNSEFKEGEQSKRSTQPSKIPVATTPKIGML